MLRAALHTAAAALAAAAVACGGDEDRLTLTTPAEKVGAPPIATPTAPPSRKRRQREPTQRDAERLRPVLDGIERADSVTVDAHKWLSAPMGAGVFITRHPRDLTSTFRVAAGYMPSAESTDPYLTSAQWSRRFTGLKVFMSLAAAGRAGYAAQIERDCRLGDLLRERLSGGGWHLVNETPLPVVCFVPEGRADAAELARIAAAVERSGEAWISVAQLDGRPALRACVISHRTTEADVDALFDSLERARRAA